MTTGSSNQSSDIKVLYMYIKVTLTTQPIICLFLAADFSQTQPTGRQISLIRTLQRNQHFSWRQLKFSALAAET